MKNLIKATLIGMALCLIFTGCQGVPFLHQHEWQDATCTTPKTCATCQKTEGEALGHQGGEATCTEKAVCTVCNLPYGELEDHIASEDDNDCTTAQTCINCPYVFAPSAASHIGGEATCNKKAECSRCGIAYGELAEHTPGAEATCTTAQTCTVCNVTLVAPSHSWNDATCKVPATCSVCGTTKNNSLGAHNYVDGICSVCGKIFIANMPTTTYELKNPNGTGVWCHEAGPQTYELASGVSMTVNGEARFTASQVQLFGNAYCDFVFPGLVSKITFTGTADRDTRIFVSTDGGENWITIKRVSSGESTTVDLMGSFQYVRIINRSDSQNKLTSITVNPA